MKKLKIVTLLTMILLFNIALAGCFEEEKEEGPLSVEIWGGTGTSQAKIYAGDSITFVILIKNNRMENRTVTLSIADKPSGWDVSLNQTAFNLTAKASQGIFLVVNSSQQTKEGKQKVKIEIVSDPDNKRSTHDITLNVVDKKGTVARQGDKVEVDYLGYLTDFSVFDTSFGDIGKERALRKAPSFTPRSTYESLKVYVGPEDPDTSDQYISTVEGFWEAIVGMKVGQSRTIVVPPNKGYAVYENVTLNITEELFMFENFTYNEFGEKYIDEPLAGKTTGHHFWGWNITIFYANETEDIVRIINEPYLNEIVNPYGWDTEVIYKNQSDNGGEGSILIKHHVEVGTQGVYQNHSAEVKSIENGQFKLDYNVSPHDLGNEIMIFDITLKDILD